MYDLAIIGGGPAGCAGAVYASRKRLRTVIITESFGGQSIDSEEIQNWIGTVAISGKALAQDLEEHVKAYAADIVDIKTGERVVLLEKEQGAFTVKTSSGTAYTARAVLIASGASRRKVTVPGADVFENKGLTYCASCDGPLFAGQDVAVIGGGNAGFETAAQLLAYAKSVTLLHRKPLFKADPITVEKVLANPLMTGIVNAELCEITGDKFVNGLAYIDSANGERKTLSVKGIFVEVGVLPSTHFAENFVERDPYGRIVTNAKNQRTNVEGIWAAGDCTDELYHQNNIAAGDAVKALEDIYLHLKC